MHAKIFERTGSTEVSAAGATLRHLPPSLGGSADFAIGDATHGADFRERTADRGVVPRDVVQRAHYFGVSKTLKPITDPKEFKGLKIVTSPEPNTNYSVASDCSKKRGSRSASMRRLFRQPGTEIAAMLAGRRHCHRLSASVAAAEAQGAKVVFDFFDLLSGRSGNHRHHGSSQARSRKALIWCRRCDVVRRGVPQTYADPAFAKEVARKEFPEFAGRMSVDKAIDAELKYLIPAQSVCDKARSVAN